MSFLEKLSDNAATMLKIIVLSAISIVVAVACLFIVFEKTANDYGVNYNFPSSSSITK